MKIVRRLKLVGALVFIIVGVVFGFVITGAIQRQHNRCTLEMPAVIIDYVTHDGDNGVTYAPVFSYTGNDGESYTLSPSTYTNNIPNIGTETTIMVNPDDPTDFYSPELDGSITKIFRIIGIVFLVIGVIMVFIPVGKRAV